MFQHLFSTRTILAVSLALLCISLLAIAPAQPPSFGPPDFGPPGPRPGGPGGGQRKLLTQFDADKNGWLNSEERKIAREFIKNNPAPRPGFGGPGRGGPGFAGPDFAGPDGRGFGPPPGNGPLDRSRPQREFGGRPAPGGVGPFAGGPPGMGPGRAAATPGQRIEKSSVEPLQADLYETSVLRTIFIDFENKDWERELEDFHDSDVDVAATLTVDGKTYENCGIHFRGMSSYDMVPSGYKRSLNVSLDMADNDQRLLKYKTLNLLNGASDESMMSSVLYSQIARQYTPAPKANFVRVVINGEYWGIYSNVQQFNKEFLNENYESDEGARWKVSGSPGGGGGLDYRGEDPESYGYPYEQKSGGKKATAKLIELCRILAETPTAELPTALEPIVDIDELLWFLALDNALINSDGYWVRASDYSIYLDEKNKFHFIPHDMNEAFRGAGGPRGRFGRGPGGPNADERGRDDRRGPDSLNERPDPERESGRGPHPDMPAPLELDPLIGIDDPSKPLRSKVLAVPAYREQYLVNIRKIAETDLDWNNIGPFVAAQETLIGDAIKTETRKLGTYEAFVAAVRPKTIASTTSPPTEFRGGHGSMNLKEFADGRRKFLMERAK